MITKGKMKGIDENGITLEVIPMLVTVEMAKKFISMSYPRQRAIKKRVVGKYATDMENHEFYPSFIRFYKDTFGYRVLINGHHRLEAIIKSGVPTLCYVSIESIAGIDAGDLYDKIDDGEKRGTADMLRARGHEDTMSMVNLKRLAGASSRLFSKFGDYYNLPVHLQTDVAESYLPEMALFLELCDQANIENKKLCYRAPVLSVILATLKYQKEPSTRFWGQMVNDDGLRKGQPQKALLDFLRKHAIHTTTTSKRKTVTHKQLSRGCMYAFNKFMLGKDLVSITINRTVKPIILIGCDEFYNS